MKCGGAWQSRAAHGSDGSAPADALTPPYVTSPCVGPRYSSSGVHEPYLLTAHRARQGKSANDRGLRIDLRMVEERIGLPTLKLLTAWTVAPRVWLDTSPLQMAGAV